MSVDRTGFAGAIVASAMDAIIAIDEKHRIVLFNDAAERIFRCSAADALGSDIERFLPERFREDHRRHIEGFVTAGATRRRMGVFQELRALRADGEEFPIEASLSRAVVGDERQFAVVLRDVTERHGMEAALRKERDFAHRLLATAQSIVLVLDASGRIVQYNAFMQELSGYDLDEVRGKSWFDTFIPGTDQPRIRNLFSHALGGRPTQGNVNAILCKDGSRRTIEWWDTELRGADGSLEGLLCIGHDVTAVREAQSDSALLAAIVLASPEAIIAATLEGTIASWNPGAEKIYGFTAAEVAERSVSMLVSDDDVDEIERLLEEVRAGRTVRRFETSPNRRDGARLDLVLSIAPVRNANGGVVAIAMTAHDITKETRAREAQADLARIVEESVNEIYVFDAGTLRFVAANRGARENLGYSVEEMLELTPLDLKAPLSRSEFEALLAPLRSEESDTVQFEATHRRKDGTQYPVEVHVQRGRFDRAECFVAIILDITQRRESEAREETARQRARQLESLASLSTLTAGIAHDIGAPMTAILGYAELIAKSVSDERNRRRARIIVDQVHRVSDLVRALLDVARPGEGTSAPVDLAGVLRSCLEFYDEPLRAQGIHVEEDLDSVEPISGDPARLQRLFLNLIVNAADSMETGGTLSISLGSPDPDHVQVQIRDSGQGMTPEIRARIFDPFFTTKKRGRGTGLGLMVAKGIVEEHGGTIHVDSEVGHGTEFALTFPKGG